MPLYIERVDSYGTQGCPPAVIEGTAYTDRTGDRITVLAPEEFKNKWSVMYLMNFREVSAEAGPPRMIAGGNSKAKEEARRLVEEFGIGV